ncbi:TonB-dependent receptor [Sphingobium sp. 10 DY56-G10]|uniref:TonB-dependent receptor n=1 Tax=Sphingobium soli TaxID=1591116 RepID=A0ABS8H702_9SPHN|nr:MULTISPECIES: TonB-dependent receptor [Sphingomonadaceae]EAT09709.1 TonB-dependent receptor [Sphingomonas sp. SKA58]MCC4234331.1 TonB-dependent receptor [Sphingobium soli]MEE2739853.1 TonB-dependent receptor [Pseudomonadota bacterium]
MALKSVIFGSTSMVALMLAGAAQAQTVPDSAAAPQADDEVNEIVVTGVRASIVGALNVRRESTQIVDSIVSEDVGKLPDNNVVEALQRVTGIQVTDRAGGETATITIRGLTDPLTTLNGRNIFTAAGTSFALQDISANLVSRVDVYKTRSADQLETGLAGQIDVQTRRPLDFDGFTISGLARGIYSELADKVNPNVALLVSDRWETGIGDIGILVNASFTRAEYRNQNLQAGAMVPFATENPPEGSGLTPLQRIFPGDRNQNWTPGLDAGLPTAPGSTLNINGVETPYYLSRDAVIASDLYGKRERPSINAALQWAPNDSSVYTAEVFYTGFRGETFNSLHFSFADWWGDLPADVANSFELYDGTNIIKSRRMGSVAGFNSGDMATNRTDSYVYALNAKWDVGSQGKISADVAYQDSKNETSFFAIRTDRGPLDLDVDFNAGGGLPAYSFGNQDVLTDASQWTVGNLFDSGTKNTGSALTLMLDGEYKWDEGFLRRIKAGFRYDDRKADSFVRDQGAGGLGVTLDAFGEGTPFTNSGFFDGRADIPTSWVLADPRSMNKDAVRQLYRAVEPGLLLSDQMTFGRVFSINESNLAAYILADGELELFGRPLQLQAGVRFVAIDTLYDYFDRGNDFARTTVSTGSEKFLPSFTARYNITDNLRIRFNYGETLRRPAFGDLNPNLSLTGDLSRIGFGTGSAGNANLRPTHSKNMDLALEWYFERNSAIYVTAFQRKIDGLVVPLTVREFIPNNYLPRNETYTEFFNITRPANASDGTLKGLEVGLTYFPSYLPSVLNGLGFTGSATILDSEQTIPVVNNAGEITGTTKSAFFGVSKLSYNATLAYDNGPIGARLSYIWRKGFLNNNEGRSFANPIGFWRAPEKSLDFQLTWNVNDDIGITFDAVNLTKAKQQNYYKFGDVGNPTEFNSSTLLIDRTFALGVRFKFD